MTRPILHFRWLAALVLLLFGAAASLPARADPPSRVVRLAYATDSVSFSPAGEDDWVRATLNRPLITGDRLWADAGARAELHLGATALRIGANTSVTLLNVDDRTAQLQLTQGVMNLRVRRLDRDQVLEIDTPNLAYSVRRPGVYRIEVDPQGAWTQITLHSGEGEVFGEGSAFVVTQGQAYRFYGTNLRDYETFGLAQPDDFERWSNQRDRRWENSASARYVSPEVIGYEDLDEHGHWRTVADYGPVWVPEHVPAGWAPYREGHWTWVEPWGWTWVDDAPWGFAPSHYGRWARVDQSWAWVPGPVNSRPVYAPAVVQFVGGGGRDSRTALTVAGVAAVAWFALAPREVYRPPYQASREYLAAVNTSNTVVTETHITNIINNTNVTHVVYANQQVTGAVVAVPTSTFAQSRPVAKTALQVTNEAVARAPVSAVAQVAPAKTSVVGAAAPASAKPPAAAAARAVVAKTAPPPPPASFAAKQSLLAAQAGKPLDAAEVARLKPAAAPATAPVVKVVSAAAPAAALPPKPASAAAATAARAPASMALPTAPTAAVRAASATAPVPAAASAAAATRAASAPPTARAASVAPPNARAASAPPPNARGASVAPPTEAGRAAAASAPPRPAARPLPSAASEAEPHPRGATAVPRPPEPARPPAPTAVAPVAPRAASPNAVRPIEAARTPTAVPSAPRLAPAPPRAAPPERPALATPEVPKPPARAAMPPPRAAEPPRAAMPPPRAAEPPPRTAEPPPPRAVQALPPPRPAQAVPPVATPRAEAPRASEPRRPASDAHRAENRRDAGEEAVRR